MGQYAPITLFLLSLANVPLPSTSPKNKCFGEAPLPCGAGRRFLLPTVVENIVWEGRFFRDKKGGKKYPTLLITCLPKNSPLLYIRSILAEVKNQIFFPYFSYTELIYSSMWQFKGKIIISLLFNFSYNYIFFS